MSLKRYLIPLVSLLLVFSFVFLFSKVLVYVLISLVIALLGLPIVSVLTKVKLGKFNLSNTIAAIITLLIFITIFYFFGKLFLPPLIAQIAFLSNTNFRDVLFNILEYYPTIKNLLLSIGTEKQIIDGINDQVNQFVNFSNISVILNNLISYLGSILGGVFSVLFISFFFLKDERMVVKLFFLLTPSRYESEMKEIIRTSRKMLSKYFTGLFIDVLLVSVLVTTLMLLFGVKNALVIGLLAGVLNIVPYIGPIITMIFAIFLGITGCIEFNQYELISVTVTKIFFILLSVNILDAMIVQPYIFSNTVKAHPLEIFIVILMAGILGGILGMIIAIPSYTLIRIVAKEFLQQFKFFKKLTDSLPDNDD